MSPDGASPGPAADQAVGVDQPTQFAPLRNPYLEPAPRLPRPIKPAGRLNALTYDLESEGQLITVTAARDADTGQLLEVVIHGPKVGSTLDLLFQDMGAWISRLAQNRDPKTGRPFRTD